MGQVLRFLGTRWGGICDDTPRVSGMGPRVPDWVVEVTSTSVYVRWTSEFPSGCVLYSGSVGHGFVRWIPDSSLGESWEQRSFWRGVGDVCWCRIRRFLECL